MNSIAEPLYLEKGFAEDYRGSLEFYNDLKLDGMSVAQLEEVWQKIK